MSPFFSICIPQYDRTDYLLAAIYGYAQQSFRDFEICISDDVSPDGRQSEIEAALKATGLEHVFRTQPANCRYDANIRTAIGLARGRYCLLMGNDDTLKDSATLGRLADILGTSGRYGVLICDFEDFFSGVRANRIRKTEDFGSGPKIAAEHFRNFSFVSGIVLEREAAQALATSRWDGSEMYQTYVGCRMIACGHALIEVAEPLVRKDLRIDSARRGVDSYAARPRLHPCPIIARPIPLSRLGQLVADAIGPAVKGNEAETLNFSIFRQLITFTYPFWLFEDRRVQSWKYAAGIALGMRPSRIAHGVNLGSWNQLALRALFSVVTIAALAFPISAFDWAKPFLYRVAKSRRGLRQCEQAQ